MNLFTDMFVVIEGTDAAGKKTQSEMLASRFRDSHRTLLYSFPRYDTPIGMQILKSLQDNSPRTPDDQMAFQFLMMADKADAASDIRKALLEGHSVVCDRWWQSGAAYGASDGLSLDWLCLLGGMLPAADLNIFIDVKPETALARRPEVRDRYEADREKQKEVHSNYHYLWNSMSKTGSGKTWVIIDGEQSIASVHGAIWAAIHDNGRRVIT